MPLEESVVNILDRPLANRASIDAHWVKIAPGNTLSQIVADYYDTTYNTKTYKLGMAQVKRHNPQITNVNRIKAGDVIKLVPIPEPTTFKTLDLPLTFDPFATPAFDLDFDPLMIGSKNGPDITKLASVLPDKADEMGAFHALAWFEESWPTMAAHGIRGAGIVTGTLGTITGTTNTLLIRQVASDYEMYKAGHITARQYSYRRQVSLETLSNKLGLLEKILFKNKSAREAIRINRSKALPATAAIEANAARLTKLSKLVGSGGNIVLGAAGLALTCGNIGHASSHQEQNEVLVEDTLSLIGGLGSGYVLGLIFVTSPIGVFTALALASASAAAGWATGKFAKEVYNATGQKIDFVGESGVRKICG